MKKVNIFFWKIIWMLVCFFSFDIFLNAAFIPGNVNETSNYYNQILIVFSSIILGMTLLLIMKKIVDSRKVRNLALLITTTLLIIFELYLAFKMQGAQGVDDFDMRLQIAKLLTGSREWSGYFGFAPNVATTIIMSGVVKLFGGTAHIGIITNIFQLVMIDIAIFMGYLMAKRHFGIKYSSLFLLICEFFSPLWLLALILYTDPIAASLGVVGIYFGDRCLETEKISFRVVFAIIATALMAVATEAKTNIVILFISWLLLILFSNKKGLLEKLVLVMISVIVFMITISGFTSLKKTMKAPTEGTFPYSYWIAIGYNSKTDGTTFKNGIATWPDTNVYKTKKEKDKHDKELILNSIKDNGVLGLISLYQRKINGQWSVGTMGVEGKEYQILKKSSSIYDYIYGSKKVLLFTLAQIIYLWILAGLFILSIFMIKNTELLKNATSLNFMAIYFLGIFSFHTFLWEEQPRYGYVVIIPMIYMATVGLINFSNIVISSSQFSLKSINLLSIVLILGLFVGFSQGIKMFTSPINNSKVVMGQEFFRRNPFKLQPNRSISEQVNVTTAFNKWDLVSVTDNPQNILVKVDGKDIGSASTMVPGKHTISIKNISQSDVYLQLVKGDKMDLLQEPISGHTQYYLPIRALLVQNIQVISGSIYALIFVFLVGLNLLNTVYLKKILVN